LFERQEVKTDKKKLKKIAKKVQKPQETKVYRKRGRKPVLNLENEMFGSFEEIHIEIDNILGEKNLKTMLGDYHDHCTVNDSISHSNTYLSSFEGSKLSSYDENFKSSNSPSDFQNLNKFAIDFESQSKLRDNY
jgi:hypothetical protein